MCSGFVLELLGQRQGRRGKVLSISVDRVGGSPRIGDVPKEAWPYMPAGTSSPGGPFGG